VVPISALKKKKMALPPNFAQILQDQVKRLRSPNAASPVYKEECQFSFDTPYSPNGLFVNLVTHLGYGKDFVERDSQKTGCRVYLHLKWEKVRKQPAPSSDVSKLGIGVEGGFDVEQ
jgi:ubiquitin carboxyl-terminal hydrolase 5/13